MGRLDDVWLSSSGKKKKEIENLRRFRQRERGKKERERNKVFFKNPNHRARRAVQ